jgi:hypothetical protein
LEKQEEFDYLAKDGMDSNQLVLIKYIFIVWGGFNWLMVHPFVDYYENGNESDRQSHKA